VHPNNSGALQIVVVPCLCLVLFCIKQSNIISQFSSSELNRCRNLTCKKILNILATKSAVTAILEIPTFWNTQLIRRITACLYNNGTEYYCVDMLTFVHYVQQHFSQMQCYHLLQLWGIFVSSCLAVCFVSCFYCLLFPLKLVLI